jgi:hypothetical protein
MIPAEDTRTTEDAKKTRHIVATFLGVQTQTSTAYGKNRKDFGYDIDDSASEAWPGAAQRSSSSAQDRGKFAVEPYQLQLWVYETKDGSMTLAEKLEKRSWECFKH